MGLVTAERIVAITIRLRRWMQYGMIRVSGSGFGFRVEVSGCRVDARLILAVAACE